MDWIFEQFKLLGFNAYIQSNNEKLLSDNTLYCTKRVTLHHQKDSKDFIVWSHYLDEAYPSIIRKRELALTLFNWIDNKNKPRPCPFCFENFIPSSQNQKYCSKKCCDTHYRRNYIKKED